MSRFNYIVVDESVIRALQDGERAALEKVYVQLSSLVYSLSLRLLSDEDLAAGNYPGHIYRCIRESGHPTGTRCFCGLGKTDSS